MLDRFDTGVLTVKSHTHTSNKIGITQNHVLPQYYKLINNHCSTVYYNVVKHNITSWYTLSQGVAYWQHLCCLQGTISVRFWHPDTGVANRWHCVSTVMSDISVPVGKHLVSPTRDTSVAYCVTFWDTSVQHYATLLLPICDIIVAILATPMSADGDTFCLLLPH